MRKIKKIIAVLLFVLGVLIAAAPFTFAAVCDVGEKVMKCHWTAQVELLLGIEIAVFAVVQFIKEFVSFKAEGFARGTGFGLDFAIAAIGAGVILIPSVLIGVCAKPMMHCHSVTRPVLIVFGILVIVFSIVDLLINIKTEN
ncbi:DUF4418 family protein [Treponema sp.]|uniref:DUF4418 family protein n=1 Tax=Treponema sp. TaxID=166 RepID=UPI00298E31DE|nr:DUF4418 family protein [Treponema sp.]MCR5614168.1 DUF4418 family protein [Treponema sp.]